MPVDFDCSRLAEIVHDLPLVQECDRLRSGALRMSTPFRYPNGEHIDVFLDSERGLFSDLYLSDSGQTALYLRDVQIVLDSTARRRELVDDILQGSGVSRKGQQLIARPASSEAADVSDAIFRLSQACVRISDFATHQRLRSTNSFKDDVEEFFEAHQLHYEVDVKLPAVFGQKELRMDFKVTNDSVEAYVNVLAAMNEAAARSSANDIFVKWHDLTTAGQNVPQKLVTVYNGASSAIHNEEIERLKSISNTVAYPDEEDRLLALLRASEQPLKVSVEVSA